MSLLCISLHQGLEEVSLNRGAELEKKGAYLLYWVISYQYQTITPGFHLWELGNKALYLYYSTSCVFIGPSWSSSGNGGGRRNKDEEWWTCTSDESKQQSVLIGDGFNNQMERMNTVQ